MYRNHNRKLEISTALTKRKSREPAYSQALVQNKIERQRIRESERQSELSDGYGGRCLELRREGLCKYVCLIIDCLCDTYMYVLMHALMYFRMFCLLVHTGICKQ